MNAKRARSLDVAGDLLVWGSVVFVAACRVLFYIRQPANGHWASTAATLYAVVILLQLIRLVPRMWNRLPVLYCAFVCAVMAALIDAFLA